MASNTKEVAVDMSPFFAIYKDGTINRFIPSDPAPLCDDPQAPVRSKDVLINPQTGLSVRIFLPKLQQPDDKIPLVVYIHGGAFCIGSASSPAFHYFISSVVEKARVIAVSVDYRLAPENPLSVTYDDSWEAFEWVMSHAGGQGPDPWLSKHACFDHVFLGGESAGANLANHVAVTAGVSPLPSSVYISGLFLLHPYFGVEDDQLYKVLSPTSGGCFEDPRINPLIDPRLSSMVCKKVMFFVAENDMLKQGAIAYYEGLKKSGWNGEVDLVETKGEGHCFYLFKPTSEKAVDIMDKLLHFLKQD